LIPGAVAPFIEQAIVRALVPCIRPMTEPTIDAVRDLERLNLQFNQTPIATQHLIHAGMYARTIMIPAGVLLTGALIKRATTLVLSGDASFLTEDGPTRIAGYCVIPASAHRKQAFLAHADTHLTMLFPTTARTVWDAEDEFTDEADLLMSRHGENEVVITEEV
jgi:hypothetical protein